MCIRLPGHDRYGLPSGSCVRTSFSTGAAARPTRAPAGRRARGSSSFRAHVLRGRPRVPGAGCRVVALRRSLGGRARGRGRPLSPQGRREAWAPRSSYRRLPAAVRELGVRGAWRARDYAVPLLEPPAMRGSPDSSQTHLPSPSRRAAPHRVRTVDQTTHAGPAAALAADAAFFVDHGEPAEAPFVACCAAGHAAAVQRRPARLRRRILRDAPRAVGMACRPAGPDRALIAASVTIVPPQRGEQRRPHRRGHSLTRESASASDASRSTASAARI